MSLFSGFEVLHGSPQSFLKSNNWAIFEVTLCLLATVVVVCPSESYSHGCEGGRDGDNGAQQHTDVVEDHRESVYQPIGKSYLGLREVYRIQHFSHEVPERQWGVIGDVVSLQWGRGEG